MKKLLEIHIFINLINNYEYNIPTSHLTKNEIINYIIFQLNIKT